jgi:hypothetical protein
MTGGALCAAALIICIIVGHAAWRGWLAAAVLCVAVPSGAVGLFMTTELTPGAWARGSGPFLKMQAWALPVGAAAFLPVLVALPAIYRWVGQAQQTPFRAVWFTEPAFIIVTIVWLAVVAVLWILLLRPAPAKAVSCVGLLLFLVIGTFAAADWVQSLDPAFNSSGFALYLISLEMLTAQALALVLGLGGPVRMERQGPVGGMLLTLLLFWGYLAFMPYFINWSANVPASAVWYLKRGRGIWAATAALTALCRFVPMFLLLFGSVRNSRRWLLAVSAVVVLGAVPEVAWLVLPSAPGAPGADLWAVAAYLLALTGLANLAWSRLRVAWS